MLLSYCVVNTNGRDHLLACLEAIRRTHPAGAGHEILVLDNASEDGSADAVRELGWDEVRLIALPRREGKAANDSRLMRESRGEWCLLLNEDAELRPGATSALLEAASADDAIAVAGAQLVFPDGSPQACAWRFPGVASALAGAVFAHRALVQSGRGAAPYEVGWVQSSAMLVRRRAAEEIGWMDPEFFVYSDETDFQRRLQGAGWRVVHVPAAHAVHHDQLASDASTAAATRRRAVEFHRNRDRYLRKHHGPAVAAALRPVLAWPYVARAIAATVLPGRSPRRYLIHARQALAPGSGEGIREAAERFNAALPPG